VKQRSLFFVAATRLVLRPFVVASLLSSPQWMHVHPISLTLKVWYSIHHVLCFIGLTAPVFYYSNAWDLDLAYVGFYIGEISNPPRCIVDLLEFEIEAQSAATSTSAQQLTSKSTHTSGETPVAPTPPHVVHLFGRSYSVPLVRSLLRSCAQVHLALFVLFRFVGAQYFVSVVWAYATLQATMWTGSLTLALSLVAMVSMINDARPMVVNKIEPKGENVEPKKEL
jgi:hypothetical protein